MALVTTMVNTFGGQWFDMHWRLQLETRPWKDSISLYVKLLTKYGPQDAIARGFNENLALFQAGKYAIWIDATVAVGYAAAPKLGSFANSFGFSKAPAAVKPMAYIGCGLGR